MAKAKKQPRNQYVQDQSQYVPEPRAKGNAQPLVPKTDAQRAYLSSLRANTLTMVKGSAGTGKTYVALTYAADLLRDKKLDKLILTRPLIGVDDEDEKIGALPGDLDEKLAVWAMPMMDILNERLGKGFVEYLRRMDKIRIVPLTYLRGTTFDNCFIHCTESQNTSKKQIKMLLTRVGENSIVVLDGDPAQSDIRGESGLVDAIYRLSDMRDVGVIEFTRDDVVRSGFCQDVLDRYEAPEALH
jgi:phosphate starvation-inducible PhoH-like protein